VRQRRHYPRQVHTRAASSEAQRSWERRYPSLEATFFLSATSRNAVLLDVAGLAACEAVVPDGPQGEHGARGVINMSYACFLSTFCPYRHALVRRVLRSRFGRRGHSLRGDEDSSFDGQLSSQQHGTERVGEGGEGGRREPSRDAGKRLMEKRQCARRPSIKWSQEGVEAPAKRTPRSEGEELHRQLD